MSLLYLDNAAAMQPSGNLPERFAELMRQYFVNGEAASLEAFQGRQVLEKADEKMLSALLGSDHKAYAFYTNSGTEAVNGAFFFLEEEFARKKHSGTLFTTRAEHPAMEKALERLAEKSSSRIQFLPLDREGGIDLKKFSDLLAEKANPLLLAVHHVQSETGRIQDLIALRKILNEKAPSVIFLADTIQSAGKIPIPWKEAGLDFSFLSGQKAGCPGGGAILARKESGKLLSAVRTTNHFIGRCPLPCAILLAEIFRELGEKLPENMEKLTRLSQFLREEFARKVPALKPTLPLTKSSPYLQHFRTHPFEGAILTRMLGEKKITISAGSACSSETRDPSPALLAMGVTAKEAFGALRISFSGMETKENMIFLADCLRDCMEK